MSVFVAWTVLLSLPWWCPRLAAWITRGQTRREQSFGSPGLEALERIYNEGAGR